MIRLLVCGGRDFADRVQLYRQLDAIHKGQGVFVLIHGDASGADTLAKEWARDRGVPVDAYRPEWDKLTVPGAVVRINAKGKPYNAAAGPARNARMLAEGKPDLVVAFKGRSGTADMIGQAVKAGVQVMLVEGSPRRAYDQVTCAWLREDRTVELSILPLAWRDYRGAQIEQSRHEAGYGRTQYSDVDCNVPSQAEIDKVVRAWMNRRADKTVA